MQRTFRNLCSVLQHPAAAELLSDGQAKGVIRTDYCGVPCQIRMDFLSPKHGLVDLKACDSLKWYYLPCLSKYSLFG